MPGRPLSRPCFFATYIPTHAAQIFFGLGESFAKVYFCLRMAVFLEKGILDNRHVCLHLLNQKNLQLNMFLVSSFKK